MKPNTVPNFPPMMSTVWVRLRPGSDEFKPVQVEGMAMRGTAADESYGPGPCWWTGSGDAQRAYTMRDEGVFWQRELPKPLAPSSSLVESAEYWKCEFQRQYDNARQAEKEKQQAEIVVRELRACLKRILGDTNGT
jgi:hypothetical protein